MIVGLPLTPVTGHITPPSSYFLRGLTICFTNRTIDAGDEIWASRRFQHGDVVDCWVLPQLQEFQLLNEEDLVDLLDQADSKNTKRQIKYAVSIFEEYCSTSGDEIEKLTDAELDDLLTSPVTSRFYAGLVKQIRRNVQQENNANNSLGLQRYFESRRTRKIDIVKGNDFKGSNNKVFKAFLEKLKKNGKGKVKRHPPVSVSSPDMQRIQQSLDLRRKGCSVKFSSM